jgi:predicted nucleic acid-binding protein
MMPGEIFLDTAYALALASSGDAFHALAASLAYQLKVSPTQVVTTRAVILEIGNALCRPRFRNSAVRLLEALEADPKVEIVPLSEDLYSKAFKLYRARLDKEWSLVDCISFIVMQERGITEALTTDQHFEQAGFVRLLKL